MAAIATPSQPEPGYWTQLALAQLISQQGLLPGSNATACEKLLWGRLVALQAAANAVLSDVDDDGIAEANDMAVLGLRQAVKGPQKPKVAKRVITSRPGTPRTFITK
ncbi:hypothetical protein [Polaromonas sp. AET17H-212]|uniref:hypothetical protein n=1 Tax=Polaromonas sp. AET17H-212 TaxID=1977061 RepID=UPI001142D9C4|nr:hypothetical protein [Polaromonas sp. AET17H-212]